MVTLNGKPLEFIHIEFWPDVGPRSFGKTDANCKFTLQTDDRSQMGAVPGSHKVSIKDTWPTKDDFISIGDVTHEEPAASALAVHNTENPAHDSH